MYTVYDLQTQVEVRQRDKPLLSIFEHGDGAIGLTSRQLQAFDTTLTKTWAFDVPDTGALAMGGDAIVLSGGRNHKSGFVDLYDLTTR